MADKDSFRLTKMDDVLEVMNRYAIDVMVNSDYFRLLSFISDYDWISQNICPKFATYFNNPVNHQLRVQLLMKLGFTRNMANDFRNPYDRLDESLWLIESENINRIIDFWDYRRVEDYRRKNPVRFSPDSFTEIHPDFSFPVYASIPERELWLKDFWEDRCNHLVEEKPDMCTITDAVREWHSGRASA